MLQSLPSFVLNIFNKISHSRAACLSWEKAFSLCTGEIVPVAASAVSLVLSQCTLEKDLALPPVVEEGCWVTSASPG